MAESLNILPIKKRPEYLAVAATGIKKPMPGLVVQMKKPDRDDEQYIRVGLTVSARAGGAVQRSRIKRRLREVIREILPLAGHPGHAYVVIGRRAALKRPYELLRDDLKTAIESLHRK